MVRIEKIAEQHGLGFLPSEDSHDLLYPMTAALPFEIPKVRSRFWELREIWDQGKTSHCVGYACNAWLRAKPEETLDGPSPEKLYREAQRRDEWPGEEPMYYGTSVRAGMKVLEEYGHVENYLWAFDALTVRDWVLLKGPVIAGTHWYTSFYAPDDEGVISLPSNARRQGGHAWLVLGYKEETGMFYCANSWGTDWGRNGYFWVPGELLEKLVRDQGQFAAAIERPLKKVGV